MAVLATSTSLAYLYDQPSHLRSAMTAQTTLCLTFLAPPCHRNAQPKINPESAMAKTSRSMDAVARTAVKSAKTSMIAIKSLMKMASQNKKRVDREQQTEPDEEDFDERFDAWIQQHEQSAKDQLPPPQPADHIDFKAILLPYIQKRLGSTDTDGEAPDSEGSATQVAEQRQLLRSTSLLLLPADTQWYVLNHLRIHAGAPERSDVGIERLSHYYGQLLFLEQSFPFVTGEVLINFSWVEPFYRDRKISTTCIQYEKAAVMFNIGAILGQMGASHRDWTEDSKKLAASYFQKAAGVLLHVRDTLTQRFTVKLDKNAALSEQTLTALSKFFLAQAMECFYERAEHDQLSSKVMSCVAAQTADYYDSAFQEASTSDNVMWPRLPRFWMAQMRAKWLLFTALANFHSPNSLDMQQSLPERLARVSLATESAQRALKVGKEFIYAGAPCKLSAQLTAAAQVHATTINKALLLLQSAAKDQHYPAGVDSMMLAPPRRPQDALVKPATFEQVVGDLKRFDGSVFVGGACWMTIGGQSQDGDPKANGNQASESLLQRCRRVVDAGKEELKGCMLDIDMKLAGLKDETKEVQSEHDASNVEAQTVPTQRPIAHATNKANANALLSSLREFHRLESIVDSKQLLSQLEKLHSFISANLSEADKLLEQSQEAHGTTDAWISLRNSATQLSEFVESRKTHMKELSDIFNTHVVDFSPTEWTEEKLRKVLPCLNEPANANPDPLKQQKLRTRLQKMQRERSVLVDQLATLRTSCAKRLEEVSAVSVESIKNSTMAGNIDIPTIMATETRQLRLLESAITEHRKDKDELFKRVEQITEQIDRAVEELEEDEHTSRILSSFHFAAQLYIRFRDGVEKEVKVCITLRKQSAVIVVNCLKHFGGSSGPGGSVNGDVSTSPENEYEDPLILELLDGTIPTSGEQGSSVTLEAAAQSSRSGRIHPSVTIAINPLKPSTPDPKDEPDTAKTIACEDLPTPTQPHAAPVPSFSLPSMDSTSSEEVFRLLAEARLSTPSEISSSESVVVLPARGEDGGGGLGWSLSDLDISPLSSSGQSNEELQAEPDQPDNETPIERAMENSTQGSSAAVAGVVLGPRPITSVRRNLAIPACDAEAAPREVIESHMQTKRAPRALPEVPRLDTEEAHNRSLLNNARRRSPKSPPVHQQTSVPDPQQSERARNADPKHRASNAAGALPNRLIDARPVSAAASRSVTPTRSNPDLHRRSVSGLELGRKMVKPPVNVDPSSRKSSYATANENIPFRRDVSVSWAPSINQRGIQPPAATRRVTLGTRDMTSNFAQGNVDGTASDSTDTESFDEGGGGDSHAPIDYDVMEETIDLHRERIAKKNFSIQAEQHVEPRRRAVTESNMHIRTPGSPQLHQLSKKAEEVSFGGSSATTDQQASLEDLERRWRELRPEVRNARKPSQPQGYADPQARARRSVSAMKTGSSSQSRSVECSQDSTDSSFEGKPDDPKAAALSAWVRQQRMIMEEDLNELREEEVMLASHSKKPEHSQSASPTSAGQITRKPSAANPSAGFPTRKEVTRSVSHRSSGQLLDHSGTSADTSTTSTGDRRALLVVNAAASAAVAAAACVNSMSSAAASSAAAATAAASAVSAIKRKIPKKHSQAQLGNREDRVITVNHVSINDDAAFPIHDSRKGGSGRRLDKVAPLLVSPKRRHSKLQQLDDNENYIREDSGLGTANYSEEGSNEYSGNTKSNSRMKLDIQNGFIDSLGAERLKLLFEKDQFTPVRLPKEGRRKEGGTSNAAIGLKTVMEQVKLDNRELMLRFGGGSSGSV
ncbi:BRO1-like domain-containing protein [Cladochytrium replicatum]|nr:BRO1-like domain-containing protein [Cladochytrium replicatum]